MPEITSKLTSSLGSAYSIIDDGIFAGEDTFAQLGSMAETLSGIASSMSVDEFSENKRITLKSRSMSNDASSPGFKLITKSPSASISCNNDNTVLFPSGGKLPVSQNMGGRNISTSITIVSNDPQVITEILSMFRSNTLYDTINNMMRSGRSLMRTRHPSLPTNDVDVLKSLRILRNSINADQYRRLTMDSIKSLSDNRPIDDFEYDMEEPLMIEHSLFNAFGYYTFIPVSATVSVVDRTSGAISIVMNCQWLDVRSVMGESFKKVSIRADGLLDSTCAWYSSLREYQIKETLESNTTLSRVMSPEYIARMAESDSFAMGFQGNMMRGATRVASAPVLAAYTLYRLSYVQRRIYEILDMSEEELKQTVMLELSSETEKKTTVTDDDIMRWIDNELSLYMFGEDLNPITMDRSIAARGVIGGSIAIGAIAMYKRTKGLMSDAMRTMLRVGGTTIKPQRLIPFGNAAITGIALESGIMFGLDLYQYFASHSGEKEPAIDCTFGDHRVRAIFKAADEGYGIGSSIYKVWKERHINNNDVSYLNIVSLPLMMSTMYVDFVLNILSLYHDTELFNETIRMWADGAAEMLGTTPDSVDGAIGDLLKDNKTTDGLYSHIDGHKVVTYISTSRNNQFNTDDVLFPDLQEAFEEKLESILSINSNRSLKLFTLEQTTDAIYDAISINLLKTADSIINTPINNLMSYFNDMRYYNPEFYRAASSTVIENCGFGMLAAYINQIDGALDKIVSEVPREDTNDQIYMQYRKYSKIYQKLTANVVYNSEEYNHIIKRARTLIAYGGRYQKNVESEVEINKALFEIMRIGAYSLLRKKHALVTTEYIQKLANGQDTYQDRYYLNFIRPYTRPEFGEFISLSFQKNIYNKGLALIVIGVAFTAIEKVLAVAIGATIGVSAGAAAIVASVLIIIASAGYMLFNSIMGDVVEENLSEKTDSRNTVEAIRNFIEEAPMVYVAFGIMNRLANAMTRNAFIYNTSSLYPPEIDTSTAPVHLQDPEVWMSSPCRYYPNSSIKGLSVLHPAFWIWHDSGDIERIRREINVTSALAASNLISPKTETEIEAAYNYSVNSLIDRAIDNNLILGEIHNIILRPLVIRIHHYRSDIHRLGKAIITTSDREEKHKLVIEYTTALVNELQRVLWYSLIHNIMADANNSASDSLRKAVAIQIIGKLDSTLIPDTLQNIKDKTWLGMSNHEYVYSNQADYSSSPSTEYGNYQLRLSTIIKISEDDFIKPIVEAIDRFEIEKPSSYESVLFSPVYAYQGSLIGTFLDSSLVGPKVTMERVSNNATPSMDAYTNTLTKYVHIGERRSKLSLNSYLERSTDTGSGNGIALIGGDSPNNIPSTKIYAAFDGNEATMGSGSIFRYVNSRKNVTRSITAIADINIRSRTIAALMERQSMLGSTIGAYGQSGVQMYQDRLDEILYKEVHKQYTHQTSKMNPVFKLYFLQENDSEWMLLDDYYAHSGIEEIHIHSDANSPMSTAVILINNFKGRLNNIMADRIYRENPFFYNPASSSDVNSAFIKPGCKVKIYQGYGSYLTEDDVVFTGEITNMEGDAQMKITCVSDGSLLMETIGSTTPEVINVSAFDAMRLGPSMTIQELAIRQTLMDSFVTNVPRASGRLSDQSLVGGTTSFDSNTLSLESTSYIGKIVQSELTLLLVAISKIASWSNIFPAQLQNYTNVHKLVDAIYFREQISHHGIVENIRITQSPVNFTYYNVMANIRETDNEYVDRIREEIEDHRRTTRSNITDNQSMTDKWITAWQSARATLHGGQFAAARWFESLIDKSKRFFTGRGYQTDTFIAHNETYYDFINEILLQLPNHIITTRPFNERNTVVIGDQLTGYYRISSSVRSDETITNNVIRTLEKYRNPSLAVELLISAAFEETEESMALFAMWYVFAAKGARVLGNASNPVAFVTLPDDEQIEAVVDAINNMVEYGVEDGIIRNENDPEAGPNIFKPENSVEARWYLILGLYTEDPVSMLKRIKTETSKTGGFEVRDIFAANHTKYMDFIRSSQLINEIEIEQPLDTYSSYAAAIAIENAAMKVVTWAVNYAVGRSHSHRRISESFYKSDGDIISNNITLQKGFNVAEIKFLSDVSEYDELNDIEDTHVKTRTFYVDSRLKWLNKYTTFIKNPPPDSALYKDRALAATGVSILSNLVKDYYGGSITFHGDSRIHPYDTIVLHDDTNDMYGTIQVKSVVKSMSRYGGSITTVTPMLPAYNDFAGSPGSETTGWGVVRDIISIVSMAALAYGALRAGRAAYRSIYLANKTAKLNQITNEFISKNFRRTSSLIGRLLKNSSSPRMARFRNKVGEKAVGFAKYVHNKILGDVKLQDLEQIHANTLKAVTSDQNAYLTSQLMKRTKKLKNNDLRAEISRRVVDYYNNAFSNSINRAIQDIEDGKVSPDQINAILEQARLDSVQKTKEFFANEEATQNMIIESATKLREQFKDEITNPNYINNASRLNDIINNPSKFTTAFKNSISKLNEKWYTNNKAPVELRLKQINDLIEGADDERERVLIARAILTDIKNNTTTKPYLDALLTLLGIEKGVNGNINLVSVLTSNRGLLGAWGTWQLYSLAGYLLNPIEDRFTAIISEYYGNNAVTISGLYSKGEPFVANLDGMKKGSIISNESVTDMMVGRFVQNFDYLKQVIYETASAPLLDATSEFTKIEAEFDQERVIKKLKQTSEIGAGDEQ